MELDLSNTTFPEFMWTFFAFVGVLSSGWIDYDSFKDIRSIPKGKATIQRMIAWLNFLSSFGIGFVLLGLFAAGLYACTIPTNDAPEVNSTATLIVQLWYTAIDLVLMAIPLGGAWVRWGIRRIDSEDQRKIREASNYNGPDRRQS